ncbi:MAG: YegP family protein [Rhodocyclaceae bacterium]|nr:YegP family protein [Rhodocyclaceae bacterium]
MALSFELTKSEKGEFYFKLLGADGSTLVRSEGYNAKASATNGIESVRKNSTEDGRYELKTASDGREFFNLKASNGQVIGTSPMFKDAAARDGAVAEVKKGAGAAKLNDKS